MASTATSVYLARRLALFPAPLRIRKKTQRSTFRRLTNRKPTYGHVCDELHGPLDDIIDEITGDIWRTPPIDPCEPLAEWETPDKLASPWTVTPLPVSRTPSDQPLTIRKTRNSRSTASGGSTFSDIMGSSRPSSKGDCDGYEFDDTPRRSSSASFASPSVAAATAPVFSGDASENTSRTPAEQQLSTILESNDSSTQPREARPARKRFFSLSNGIGKLRFKTGSKEKDTAPDVNPSSMSKASISSLTSGEKEDSETANASSTPTIVAVSEWMEKNGRRASMVGTLHSQVAEQFPSPLDYRQELPIFNGTVYETNSTLALLTTAVKILPEIKVLETEEVDFWVTVEVEGVLHNRHMLANPGIDVVFLIDNGYYVTKDCFNQAVDLVAGALHDLKKCDRFGLFTTHCTHEEVTGIVPEVWYSLDTVDKFSHDTLRETLANIQNLGTQTWKWSRPNPSMTEVILAVAKSLECREPRQSRTHIVLLSPVAHGLHELSETQPSLRVHQVNPAVLPFHNEYEPEEKMCFDECCGNFTVSNWAFYQPVADRLRQILRYARAENPLGTIFNVHADLRPRSGCEVLKYEGSTDIPSLHLGQIHSFSAQIRVVRSETMAMDLKSADPIRDSSLEANNLRQDLRNAMILGAAKVHLLSVQVMHQSSLLPLSHWNFSETPLLVIKEIGRLTWPTDRALEVYKRRFFHKLSRLQPELALAVVGDMGAVVKPELKESAQKVLDRMAKELEAHKAIIEYEKTNRQNLPSCPGPISIPPPHDFVVKRLEARKSKKTGVNI